MLQVNVHDAKTRFSKLLARVQAGETVLIAKNGRQVAKIVPLGGKSGAKRRFGTARKSVRLAPGWNAPLPRKLLDAFES